MIIMAVLKTAILFYGHCERQCGNLICTKQIVSSQAPRNDFPEAVFITANYTMNYWLY